ncbi:MAG: hypothetical protein L0Z62_00935 [Gemmataceae bacterium]|nr:hypothetical protein [Gemmataceae bacterium]
MAKPQEREAQIKKLGWSGLQKFLTAVRAGDPPGWDQGEAFEYLVLRAFELDGAQVRYPYTVTLFDERAEEIDGAIHLPALSALVESKDLGMNVAIGPIAKLRNQLLRRPSGTVGVLFSARDFTPSAILLAHFALPQCILLWRVEELALALKQKRMAEFLRLKYRICVENGVPDFVLHEGAIP